MQNQFDKYGELRNLSAINVQVAFVICCIPDHKVKTLVDQLKELVVWGKKKKDGDEVISIISSTKI